MKTQSTDEQIEKLCDSLYYIDDEDLKELKKERNKLERDSIDFRRLSMLVLTTSWLFLVFERNKLVKEARQVYETLTTGGDLTNMFDGRYGGVVLAGTLGLAGLGVGLAYKSLKDYFQARRLDKEIGKYAEARRTRDNVEI